VRGDAEPAPPFCVADALTLIAHRNIVKIFEVDVRAKGSLARAFVER
jgi:hypothetical protein